MSKKLPLVEATTEQKFFDLFKQHFVSSILYTHDQKIVKVKEGHFRHIFFRDKKSATPYFDIWLAKRMLWIREIILCSVSNIEVYEQYNSGKKRSERVYIYTYEKFCVFLGEENAGNLYIITAYRKNHNEIGRFKKSPSVRRIK